MIEWHKPTRGKVASGTYAAIGTQKSTAHAGVQIVLRFSASACKDLRLIEGDRVLIGFDEPTNEVCFKRVSDTTGYKLSGKTSKSLTVTATIQDLPFFNSTPVEKEHIKQEGTHVSIYFPKMFELKNARDKP